MSQASPWIEPYSAPAKRFTQKGCPSYFLMHSLTHTADMGLGSILASLSWGLYSEVFTHPTLHLIPHCPTSSWKCCFLGLSPLVCSAQVPISMVPGGGN